MYAMYQPVSVIVLCRIINFSRSNLRHEILTSAHRIQDLLLLLHPLPPRLRPRKLVSQVHRPELANPLVLLFEIQLIRVVNLKLLVNIHAIIPRDDVYKPRNRHRVFHSLFDVCAVRGAKYEVKTAIGDMAVESEAGLVCRQTRCDIHRSKVFGVEIELESFCGDVDRL
jgi:hypothetical protein